MGVKDTVTAKYMRQNEIFADAFNYFVYGGEAVISPDSLEEIDTRELDIPYGGEKGVRQPVQKIRDVIKSVTAMTDQRTAYLLLAIENQANIHYAMPVKNLVYDALQYAKQIEKAAASHRLSGDYKGRASDEYLSGFLKEDRLIPVITLVIYFGAKQWDGPLSLHEMFKEPDERVLTLVPDYKINLIAPAAMDNDAFRKFRTTLGEVLLFIKYSDNADKLEEVIGKDQRFQHFGRTEVDVLNACVNAKLSMKKNEEVLDMCQAIQTIADRAAEKKRIATLLDNVQKLMENLGWSEEQSMNALSISENDRETLFQQMKQEQ